MYFMFIGPDGVPIEVGEEYEIPDDVAVAGGTAWSMPAGAAPVVSSRPLRRTSAMEAPRGSWYEMDQVAQGITQGLSGTSASFGSVSISSGTANVTCYNGEELMNNLVLDD